MKRSALVTGSEGFVGKHLCALLSAKGWELRGCDLEVPAEAKDRRACDIADPAQIERLLQWAEGVTHVFHLAAVTFLPEAARDPALTFRVNLNGTVGLATSVHRHAPNARFVYVSTSEVYGIPQTLPLRESHPLCPANPYAISKAAADQYCAYLYKTTGQDVVRLRPFNHTGPGQEDRFALPSFARQIAEIEAGESEPVLKVGNLDAVRDLSSVGDVVRAYEVAALEARPGEAYNICSGNSAPMRQALDMLLSLSTADIAVEVDSERLRPSEVPEIRGSHEKLSADTGWRPEISLEELLSQLLSHWRGRAG